jgi:hypothetical protein
VKRGCAGFDTETINGRAFLLGYSFREKNSGKEQKGFFDVDSFSDFIDFCKQFLFKKDIFKDNFCFFWNLQYDAQAILKHLPNNILSEIAVFDRAEIDCDVNVRLIPEKCFEVNIYGGKRWRCARFYDIMQYYSFMRLQSAAEEYLQDSKQSFDAKNINYNRYQQDLMYQNELRQYCIHDAVLTRKLAEIIHLSISQLLQPRKYYSQASIAQQYFLERLQKPLFLPSKKILQYAMNCYQGGRFETFQRGLYPKGVYSYDISSAYPAHAVMVPDVSNGKWEHVNDFEQCDVGIFKCNVKAEESIISSLKYSNKNKAIVYPHGDFKEVFLNKNEYEIAIKFGARVKVIDGYIFNAKDLVYPYSFLRDVYKLKQSSAGVLKMTYKIILNGFYGKLIQIIESHVSSDGSDCADYFVKDDGEVIYYSKAWKAGVLFNPIAANEITANTRCQLLESSYGSEEDVICFATDCIKSTKPLHLDIGNNLGQWVDESKKGEFVILGSGVYSHNQVKGGRMRGFLGKVNLFDVLNKSEFSVSQNYGLKRANVSGWDTYNIIRDVSCRVGTGLKVISGEKRFELNFDHKRAWERQFEGVKDVLSGDIIHSKTLDINTLI